MIILMENKNKGFLMAGLVLGGLMLMSYLAVFVVPQVLVTFSRATQTSSVSLTESYLVGMKMLAKADGVDSCKVDVFAMDASGKGVMGKSVVLKGIDGLKAQNAMTDGSGSVVFDLVSKNEGQFTVTAVVDGLTLPKKLTVTFRNSD